MQTFPFEEIEFVLLSKEDDDTMPSATVQGVFKTEEDAKLFQKEIEDTYPEETFYIFDVKTAAKKVKLEEADISEYKEQFALHASVHYVHTELDRVLPKQFSLITTQELEKVYETLQESLPAIEEKLAEFDFGDIQILPFMCMSAPILAVKVLLSDEEDFVESVTDPLIEFHWIWRMDE